MGQRKAWIKVNYKEKGKQSWILCLTNTQYLFLHTLLPGNGMLQIVKWKCQPLKTKNSWTSKKTGKNMKNERCSWPWSNMYATLFWLNKALVKMFVCNQKIFLKLPVHYSSAPSWTRYNSINTKNLSYYNYHVRYTSLQNINRYLGHTVWAAAVTLYTSCTLFMNTNRK